MRYTQPQSGPVQIDGNNPYAHGIDVAFVRLDQPGLIGAAALAKVGSPSLVTTKYGQGWFCGNTTSDGFSSSNWPVLADGTEYTYLVVIQLTATGTTDFLVNGDNAFRAFQFRIETTGAPGFIGFNTAVSTFSAVGSIIPIGQVQAIAARSSTTAVSLFQNGVKTATTAASGTIKGQSASDISIANRINLNLHGSIGLLIRWPRALSDAEAQAVTANPWQLFRSPQRVMLAAAAGPDVTIALTGQATTAAAGTVSPSNAIPVAGSSATVAAGSVSVGSDVTVALAGQAMTASRGTLAPVVTKALTGQSSTATPGSVSQATSAGLTGQASNAQQGLLTPARAIVISGQSGAASAGTIGPGTVAALAGQSSTTQQGVVATSGNKTVALTGQSASVAQGALTRSTPEAVFALATIMRQSAIAVQGGTMKSTVAAQGGTIKATLALSTIMRQSQINTRATMTNAPINRTVAFI